MDSVGVAVQMAQSTVPSLGEAAALEIMMHETLKAEYPPQHLAYFFAAAIAYSARLQTELDSLKNQPAPR